MVILKSPAHPGAPLPAGREKLRPVNHPDAAVPGLEQVPDHAPAGCRVVDHHGADGQLRKMPADVKARMRRIDERKVLRQSFVMRNRNALRVLGVGAGLLMIGTALVIRVRSRMSF